VKPLTPQLAEEFVNLPASPTERSFDQARAKMLREKAEHGQLIAFNWAKAHCGDKVYRMNGQHSSRVLVDLNGSFPEGLKAHIDTYKVDTQDDLAELFRQFDSRKSGRTPNDVAGAYQGLQHDLDGVTRPSAKLAVEGVNWWQKHVEGLPAEKGDDVYSLFSKAELHPFIKWVGDVFTVKTPELRRQTIVAAMYATYEKSETEAQKFWAEVARGGVEFEENHPTTVLDAFLKSIIEDKRKLDLKPANLYQASIYAWNAFREDKTITTVKYDTKKGLYTVSA
jgi:hypothetical protein